MKLYLCCRLCLSSGPLQEVSHCHTCHNQNYIVHACVHSAEDLIYCKTGQSRDETASQSWHVAWSGNASRGQHLEVPGALAGCLGIAQGITVTVRAVPDIPEAIGVCVEPISVDDWEVVEQNAGHMEDQILTQVYNMSLALLGFVACSRLLQLCIISLHIVNLLLSI